MNKQMDRHTDRQMVKPVCPLESDLAGGIIIKSVSQQHNTHSYHGNGNNNYRLHSNRNQLHNTDDNYPVLSVMEQAVSGGARRGGYLGVKNSSLLG